VFLPVEPDVFLMPANPKYDAQATRTQPKFEGRPAFMVKKKKSKKRTSY